MVLSHHSRPDLSLSKHTGTKHTDKPPRVLRWDSAILLPVGMGSGPGSRPPRTRILPISKGKDRAVPCLLGRQSLRARGRITHKGLHRRGLMRHRWSRTAEAGILQGKLKCQCTAFLPRFLLRLSLLQVCPCSPFPKEQLRDAWAISRAEGGLSFCSKTGLKKHQFPFEEEDAPIAAVMVQWASFRNAMYGPYTHQ